MKIAACLITKGDDELASLKRAVGSIANYVQEVHITANSDHEETKRWCKKNGYDFSYLKWNKDFSIQRNFNFNRASSDCDYIFWMDSDDILVNAHELPKIAKLAQQQELDCLYMTYWYSCEFDGERTFENVTRVDIIQERERLLNPRKIRWVGRLHETPLPFEGVKFKHSSYKYSEASPMVVLHTGAWTSEPAEVTHARNMRNREVLELQLKEEREMGKADPRTILYLMKIYAWGDDEELHKLNLKLGPEYIQNSGWDEEIATCWLLMAKSAGYFNQWEEAEKYIFQAMKVYPNRTEIYLRLAEVCFFLRKYKEMEHWMEMGLSLEEKKETSSVDNVHLNKLLASELTTRYFLDVKQNFRKAFKASEEVYKLNPNKETHGRMEHLRELANLDIACEHTDKLCQYLIKDGDKKAVLDLLHSLPQAIQMQPFSLNMLKKYQKPRIWQGNEICYFANFGGKAFEEWSPLSLKKGLGGSETAVVKLSKYWASLGFKVTVYGDPGTDYGMYDGVTYLPYLYFNKKDKFNIFIQWRDAFLSDKISSKKFFVDLHDVTHAGNFTGRLDQIDKIFVKSEAHKNLLQGIDGKKIAIISNGIDYETT
jgi:tetratricopeptide (TPR) repeat protein